ncbi:MAG: hypothetical protein HZB41_03855 [Ignavibacteriae bacterium]|nr:hypothetical protein [Ignavibacteriota bacterium]
MNLNIPNNFPSEFGQPSKYLSEQPILTVLEFIENLLPTFVNRYKNTILNENGLTQNLVRLLGSNLSDNYPFFFDKEGIQDVTKGNSASVDIEVISKTNFFIECKTYEKEEPFFAFEAKILGVKEKYRHKEYLIGFDNNYQPKPCGGIERFKKNIHCSKMSKAGMIGYIIKSDFNTWREKINQWIQELIINPGNDSMTWSINDKLTNNNNQKNKDIAKYYSNHERINDNSNILLIHLWINLC